MTAASAWGPSAEVIPFPISAREVYLGAIADQYCRSRRKKYLACDVISNHQAMLERLGVAPERVAAEIGYLEGLFGLGDDTVHQERLSTGRRCR